VTGFASLAEVRAAIDAIDRDLVRLLARRAEIVRAAAAFKSDAAAVKAPDRVETVVRNARALAVAANADPDLVETIYRAMIAAMTDAELREHAARTGKPPRPA
jgi:isochorismate pyruvate lyase